MIEKSDSKDQFIHEPDCYVLVRDAERRYIDSRERQENKLWFLFNNVFYLFATYSLLQLYILITQIIISIFLRQIR